MAASLLSGGAENVQSDIETLIQNEQEWSGASIRRIREAKRISLEDLSDYTRISRAYLGALEEEDYNRLPAGVYVRGFLQQVAKRLKLPVDRLVPLYVARMKTARPDKA
jgi:flagellar biosynthesis protein FlhG